MFEEPYRWMEAVSTRHSYVQEKLKLGQPVLSVPFDEGVLIMGFAPQPGKIFEIYDRIALGGVGHPADVERLRMTLLEMAHLEGFNRSAQDVTLARLLQFGIAPALKQNLQSILLAPGPRAASHFRMDWTHTDGAWLPAYTEERARGVVSRKHLACRNEIMKHVEKEARARGCNARESTKSSVDRCTTFLPSITHPHRPSRACAHNHLRWQTQASPSSAS